MISTTDKETVSETVSLAQRLIQFDTSNYGGGKANPELPAAKFVANYLTQLGLQPQIIESAPGRANVVARIAGKSRHLPAVVMHGHLDVVPAEPSDWSVDPFAGVIKDGMLWGRGAVDMKNMDAMLLTAIAELLRSGKQPRRDIILAFFADEENGGEFGSAYMVKNHPELFAGAKYAVSEVGGYSVYFGERRVYLIQAGEKSLDWVRIRARGKSEHGSKIAADNPVQKLASALTRLSTIEWQVEVSDTTAALLQQISDLTGPGEPSELLQRAGTGAGFLAPSVRTTVNPTVISGGYMHNVIPETAEAILDIRCVPGSRDTAIKQIRNTLGDEIEVEFLASGTSLEAPFKTEIVAAMHAALKNHDPDAVIAPYLLGAGTDNKALASLGISGYGFAPLQLPPELDFPALFHGVDERIPLTAIDFGHRVLSDFIRTF